MPASESHREGSPTKATPLTKRKRIASSPLLATPTLVLEQVKNGDNPDEERRLQALCNAVISAAVGDEEDEEAVTLLTELLAQEGIDPNAGHENSLRKFGGSPLYQACKLDLPETTRALLEHGASVVQAYENETPLEVALSQKDSRCVKVIMDHVARLEALARASRKRA